MSIMKYLLVSIAFLFLGGAVFSQTGKLTGKVLSMKTGDPLIGATVALKDKGRTVKTDQNGAFSFGGLQPGNYVLVVSYVSFTTKTTDPIKVVANDVTTQDVLLEEAGKLQAVVVKSQSAAPRVRESVNSLLILQKNRASVSDGISQESIKKTPDRNVSDVLKRVTGASVQDEKFVIVRGLNDRYNASFLNGAALPSSEDSRKAFAFNIFPANVIDNLIIQKTATPDMPGEFAGGLINIETKGIPAQNFQSFSFGLGYNTITTFKEREYYRGGRWDFLGFDNGVRALPDNFPSVQGYKSLTNRELVTASQTFPNYWKIYKGSTMPNLSMQYSLGKNIQRNQKEFLGLILSATYSRSFSNGAGETNGYDINQGGAPGQFGFLELNRIYPDQHQSATNTLLGLLANASLKINGNNTISFKNLLSISSDDRVIVRVGLDDPLQTDQIVTSSAFWFTSNRIFSSQLIGEHYEPKSKIKINWVASFSNIDREIPSLRTMKYRLVNGQQQAAIGAYTNEGAGNILYFNNNETGINTKLDLSRSFKIAKVIQNQFKAGFYYQKRDRTFNSRKLNFNRYTLGNITFDNNLLNLPQDQIFNPKYMGVQRNGLGGFYIDDATQPEDSYEGFSELYAYYGMLDQRFGKFVRLIYGARIEDFHLLFYSARLGAIDPIQVNTRKQDVLPSANVVFTIGQKQNLRFSYAQTVNRPEFLELAPFLFYDFSTRLLVSGRETNKRALIDNYDARYEYFPGRAQLISVSFFHKKFTDPIELRFLNGVSTQAEYVNLPSAEVTGGEIEIRSLLGALFNSPEKSILNRLTVYGNYTQMESKLVITTDTSQKRLQSNRPMQGQSPYVFNAGVTYQDDTRGFSATLSANRVGPRIFITGNGQDGDYDILEAPRTVLDLQVAKTFAKKNMELKLNIKDLLAQNRYLFYDTNADQDLDFKVDPVLNSLSFGRIISLNLTYKF